MCVQKQAIVHRRQFPDIGGSLQKKACPAWGRKLKESRSGGHHLRRGRRSGADLSSERFRGFPWPMSHSGKFPASDGGALLRSMKQCLKGCFSVLRWSPTVPVVPTETNGVRGCSVQGPLGDFSLFSCFGGVSRIFAGPAVLLECSRCVRVLYFQWF